MRREWAATSPPTPFRSAEDKNSSLCPLPRLGWYRHITLAQLTAAFLTVSDAQAARESGPLAVSRFGGDLPPAPTEQRGGPG